MKHSIKISVLMVFAIISNTNLFAVVRTWNGVTSNAWATASNWSGSTVPGTNDTVVIPGSTTNNPTISAANVTVRRMVLGGNLTTSSSRTLTVSGSLVLNAGTLSLSANFTCPNVTINGGTFSINNSPVITISSNLLINGGSINLSNVNTGANSSIASVDLNGGTFTVGQNLNSDITGLISVDGGALSLSSDFRHDGSFEFISGTIALGSRLLDLRSTYTYTGGSFTASNGGTLSASIFNFNYSGTLTLNHKIKIRDTLSFINGKIQSNANYLVTFRYNAASKGQDNNKHITGPVRKEISLGNITPDFTFPIGNGTYYAPLTISNYGNRSSNDTFTAQYFNSTSPNASGTLGTGLSVVSNQEYWILNRTSSGTAATTATVALSYNTARSGSITDASLLKIARWNGTQWADHGRASSSSTSTTSGTLISSANVTSFSPFTLGSSSNVNPLPVHLLDFSAKAIAASVDVKWNTTSEINNDYFNIEKSLDGKNWSMIGQVKGAGNTESLTSYNFVDANPVNGLQYYRLKQVDVNGTFSYSNIAPVNFTSNFAAQLNIFPMPASSNINIELPGASEMTVTIYNANGQKIYENNSGSLLNIDIQNFEAGVYMVEVKADTQIISSKFLKN